MKKSWKKMTNVTRKEKKLKLIVKTPQENKIGIGSSKIRNFKTSYVVFDQFNKGRPVKNLCYPAWYSMLI